MRRLGCEVLDSDALVAKARNLLPDTSRRVYLLRATTENQLICGYRVGSKFAVEKGGCGSNHIRLLGL